MKILVADTSSSVCITGVFENDKLIAENCLDNGKTHSENFMPLIKKSLEDAKLSLNDIDVIGIVVGPGSFTGIRIGIASCKAMAEVIGLKVVPIVSLESLAGNEMGNSEVICSMIDARNNQVYCGIFDGNVERKDDFMADDINIVLERIGAYDNIVFVGDGAVLHKELIEEKLQEKNISFSENNKQNVISLGKITYKKACNGELFTADDLIPMYLRKSQAERMKNKVKIVSMNEKYLDRLCANLEEYDEFWRNSILEDEFNNESSKYFVAINESDEILAFGGLWFNIDEAHVMNIAVKKEFRRKHIGTELLEVLVGEARRENKKCVTLEVREDNVQAIGLYKKFGFLEVGKRKKYYNKLFDAIIMTKFLSLGILAVGALNIFSSLLYV